MLQTEGIIFKSIKYGETSLIMDIYTASEGLKSFIVGSVRSKKSKKSQLLYKPMQLVSVVAYPAKQSSLSRIKSLEASVIYSSINVDILKSLTGMFMLDLARNVIKESFENEALFTFLKQQFVGLDQDNPDLRFYPLRFAIQLNYHLGVNIMNNFSQDFKYFDLAQGQFMKSLELGGLQLIDTESKDLAMLLNQEFDHLKLRKIRATLLDNLMKFYQYHIPNFKTPKSLDVLRDVMD